MAEHFRVVTDLQALVDSDELDAAAVAEHQLWVGKMLLRVADCVDVNRQSTFGLLICVMLESSDSRQMKSS
jgi:hypothetical protein